MSETDLIIGKNDALRKKNVIIILQQIFLFLALAGYAFILIVSRLTPPAVQPKIDPLARDKIGGYELQVPKVVTVGEQFNYRAKGTKNVESQPEVRLQVACKDGDALVVQTISTYTSIGVAKGPFDIKRTTSIPVSTKNIESKDCKLQSISTFTFYTVDANGNQSSFQVPETAESNPFELRLPKSTENTSSTSSTNSNRSVSMAPSTPAQTNVNTDNNKKETTSGSGGSDPNSGSNSGGETKQPTPVRDLLNAVTSPVTNLLNRIGE